ncbi:MAG: hypothetical protein PUF78_00005, partial [Lachnospiraceae bacterium]|nr:hypothetical protein [Lachnospiraceae bacterium]
QLLPFFTKSSSFFQTKYFDTWARYLVMMTFNVPLEMTEETLDISHPTALLWRHKVFATISDYQENLVLHGRIWIDETISSTAEFFMRTAISENEAFPKI